MLKSPAKNDQLIDPSDVEDLHFGFVWMLLFAFRSTGFFSKNVHQIDST